MLPFAGQVWLKETLTSFSSQSLVRISSNIRKEHLVDGLICWRPTVSGYEGVWESQVIACEKTFVKSARSKVTDPISAAHNDITHRNMAVHEYHVLLDWTRFFQKLTNCQLGSLVELCVILEGGQKAIDWPIFMLFPKNKRQKLKDNVGKY